MADRKNLKISPEVYERLNESKESGRTWDDFLLLMHKELMDPRPRVPKDYHTESDGPGTPIHDFHHFSEKELKELAKQADALVENINFVELLQESESDTEAVAEVMAEATAERVVDKLETRIVESLGVPADD